MLRIDTAFRNGISVSVADGRCDSPTTLPFPRAIETLDDIGPILTKYFTGHSRLEKISSTWQASFGIESCPMCNVPQAPCGASDHSSVIQSTESPESVSSTTPTVTEWGDRALKRLRQHPLSNENVSQSICDGDIVVEELFTFDSHIMRHLLNIPEISFVAAFTDLKGIWPRGGKSGARFASAGNGSLILKSISRKEEDFLRCSAPRLYDCYHSILFHDRKSVLVPLLGAFTVKTKKSRLTFVVMPNVAPINSCLLFDLKGVVKRKKGIIPHVLPEKTDHQDKVDASERDLISPLPGVEVLWDEEFRQWCDKSSVRLDEVSLEYFKNALISDTEFLSGLGTIDYSLFVALQFDSSNVPVALRVGIIDFLRLFTWDKKIESVVKTVNSNIAQLGSIITGGDGPVDHELELIVAPTVIRPELYARRFHINILKQFKSQLLD